MAQLRPRVQRMRGSVACVSEIYLIITSLRLFVVWKYFDLFIYFFLLSFGSTVCDPDKPVAIPKFEEITGVYLPSDEKLTDCIMNQV